MRTVCDAYSGAPIGELAERSVADAPALAAAAHAGFARWRRSTGAQRAEVLEVAAERLSRRADAAARLICDETGKPIRMSAREVRRAVGVLREAAAESRTATGSYRRLDGTGVIEDRVGIVSRFPRGPVLAITPANSPLNLVIHKLAPALAAGCSVLLKPHERAGLTGRFAAELFDDLLPDGAVQVAAGGRELAAALLRQPQLRVLSFTGGQVGWRLAQVDPTRHALLELGGNAPTIVWADADVAQAAEATAAGAFGHGGQSCVSPQRALVHEDVLEDFTRAIVGAAQAQRIGDPHDHDTDIGPLPVPELDRLDQLVQAAVAAGARVLCGGERAGRSYRPTVLAGVSSEQDAWQEEVFGPILCLRSVGSLDEAIALANDSAFGLHAGVFTADIRVAMELFQQLETGGLTVGDSSDSRADPLPYGGWKRSGSGREGVRSAILEYSADRTLILAGVAP